MVSIANVFGLAARSDQISAYGDLEWMTIQLVDALVKEFGCYVRVTIL